MLYRMAYLIWLIVGNMARRIASTATGRHASQRVAPMDKYSSIFSLFSLLVNISYRIKVRMKCSIPPAPDANETHDNMFTNLSWVRHWSNPNEIAVIVFPSNIPKAIDSNHRRMKQPNISMSARQAQRIAS